MYSGFAVSHLGVAPGLAEEPPEFPSEIMGTWAQSLGAWVLGLNSRAALWSVSKLCPRNYGISWNGILYFLMSWAISSVSLDG